MVWKNDSTRSSQVPSGRASSCSSRRHRRLRCSSISWRGEVLQGVEKRVEEGLGDADALRQLRQVQAPQAPFHGDLHPRIQQRLPHPGPVLLCVALAGHGVPSSYFFSITQRAENENRRTPGFRTMNTSTSEAGGCHYAGIALCSSRTRATRNTVCQLREDCYLPPVNGLLDGILSCSPISSSFSWFLTYSAIRLSFFPTVST